ncbi:MAG TPA: hypothetical protein VFT12_04855 [Thermoanaerobaculia bacterium]|nr:hypothetical protein [Thermoanaerobaculia bacterium]
MRAFALAALTISAALSVSAEEPVSSRFQSAVPSTGVRRVIVDIPTGDIVIRNGDATRLAVSGSVSRDPDGPRSREKEQRIVNHTAVEIVVRNGEATVQRRYGPDAQGWRAQTFSDYAVSLEVPVGVAIDVKTRAGDVTLDGSFGDIDVDLRAGDVTVRLPRADVRELRASCRIGEVRTNIGNEIVEREGLFPGRTRYLNAAGKFFVNVHATVGEVNVELR